MFNFRFNFLETEYIFKSDMNVNTELKTISNVLNYLNKIPARITIKLRKI